MAHPPEKRQEVRSAYVHQRLTLEAAAEKAGVPYGTARRWKTGAEAEGDDWDKARAANSLSHGGANTIAQLVLSDFLVLHQATVDGLTNAEGVAPLDKAMALSRLADAFQKTMAAVSKASPELGRYAVANELLQDLVTFVREEHPDATAFLVEVLEPFAVRVAKKYG